MEYFSPRAEPPSAPRDDFRRQRNIRSDHQIARFDPFYEVKIGCIKPRSNFDGTHKSRWVARQRPVRHPDEGEVPSLRRPHQQFKDVPRTGVSVDPYLQSAAPTSRPATRPCLPFDGRSHLQHFGWIGDGVDFDGITGLLGNIVVGDEMDVEKTFRAITGPQKIQLRQRQTPTGQPF